MWTESVENPTKFFGNVRYFYMCYILKMWWLILYLSNSLLVNWSLGPSLSPLSKAVPSLKVISHGSWKVNLTLLTTV
jgi:hypothetical protein